MNQNIKIIASKNSWIEQSAIDQLKQIASLDGIIKAVGLPDLHPGKTPIGAAFITKDIIYPHIIGNDIGCGMSLFMLPLKKHKINIGQWIKKLEKIEDIKDIEKKDFIKEAVPFYEQMGTIGSGNHFAEFQTIDKIWDEEIFTQLKLDKKKIMLLIHSGSRSYGQAILDETLKKYESQNGLMVQSHEGKEYLKKHENAIVWANHNRKLIAYRILKGLGVKTNPLMILDSTHNSITKKAFNNQNYYIHRKGTSPSDIGPIVIAGSRGSLSYIVMPKDCTHVAYSLAHGAGRKWSRTSCKEKLQNKYTKKTIKQNQLGGHIICNNQNLLFEEAPEAYKNIERVIQDLLDEDLIKIVATLKPILTYKG